MVAGYIPFDAGRSSPRELPERVFVELPKPNLSNAERGLTLVAGLVLAAEGLRRRGSLHPLAVAATVISGGLVAARAIGGYCPIEARIKDSSGGDKVFEPQGERVRQFLPRILRSISIRASREEIVARLRELPNVDGVRFEVAGDSSGDEIAWRCHKIDGDKSIGKWFGGVIRLIDGPPKKGVEIQASIDDIPEGVTAEEVEGTLRKILRALKQFVEAGEIATTSGQSHGTRRKFSFAGRLGRLVNKLKFKSKELRDDGVVLERS